MENEKCLENNLNKRKIKRNENLAKRTKYPKMMKLAKNIITQQAIKKILSQNISAKAIQNVPDTKGITFFKNFNIQHVSKDFPTLSYSNAPIALSSNSSDKREQNDFNRDTSEDKAAIGDLDGQISSVPDYLLRSNGNRRKSFAFRTPSQSPTLCIEYCSKLLMAPKKR